MEINYFEINVFKGWMNGHINVSLVTIPKTIYIKVLGVFLGLNLGSS